MSRTAIWILLLLVPLDAAAQKPCLRNGKCEVWGCATPGSMAAKANEIRNAFYERRRPATVHELCVGDFETLQSVTPGRQGFLVRNRSQFADLKIRTCFGKQVKLGEKSFVSVVGLIVGAPRAPAAESANCQQRGREYNSFRLNLVADSLDTEFQSVSVALTPRMRKEKNGQGRRNWDMSALAAIARSGRPIRVTGPLFYDSRHVVNSDPENDLPEEPRRSSLWEIHPVTLVELCTQKRVQRCFDPKTATWEMLEDAQWLR